MLNNTVYANTSFKVLKSDSAGLKIIKKILGTSVINVISIQQYGLFLYDGIQNIGL